jgi:uncharacterized membrane protein (DUF4010 family)
MSDALPSLAIALAAGLIVGMERGWVERGGAEGSRLAGVRTFALIGLLGGLWELLGNGNPLLFGFAFFGFAVVMAVAHFAEARDDHDYGITTVVAALITFVLGAVAVRGQHVAAAAGAVVVATLLSLKPVLHGWLARIEQEELSAALKLMLISIVVLPLIPDRGYGPWEAINPYRLWWFVVLLSAISFAAYVAVKIGGPKHGILWTGVLGGLISSTGVTVQLSRLSKKAEQQNVIAAGILVSCGTMFLRVLLVVAFVNRDLLLRLVLPFLVMALPLYLAAFYFARQGSPASVEPLSHRNPLEIVQALKFGVLLAVILLASKALQVYWGSSGLHLAAIATGLADVDAITISIARMTSGGLPLETAAIAATLAAMANTLTKGVLSGSIGGKILGTKILFPVAVALAGGATALLLG